MFTMNIYLRWAAIGIFLGGGILLAFVYGFWYALPLLLIGLIFLGGYIFLGTVQKTAQLVQEGNFMEAEKTLNYTLNPNWLYKTNRAFYYLIKGTLAMQRKDNDEAEEWLVKAQSIELPSDNERGMVLLQLANIQGMKNNWKQAKIHFNAAKKLKITEPQLKEQIKHFEKAITNRGQAKHMQQGGMRGRKGFRQRKIK